MTLPHEEFARLGGYSEQRLTDRAVTEMLGMCRAVLMDGKVDEAEVVALERWCQVQANQWIRNSWPGDVIYQRLCKILEDGEVDPVECEELREMFEALTGRVDGKKMYSPTLPLSAPPPEIVVIDETFCFTGTFAYGNRRKCADETKAIGGHVSENVTKKVNHLVIGEYTTQAWIQSSFGRKIEKAIALREIGVNLHIVSERHWYRALRGE